MRKFSLAGLVTTAFVAAAAFMPGQAQAVPLAAAPASLAAINTGGVAEQVRYVCRRVWRCGRSGCGWRRSCFWRPGRGGPYFGYYFGSRRYYHRPYRYRHHHRHRHWHR
jgi:hypothetical protein